MRSGESGMENSEEMGRFQAENRDEKKKVGGLEAGKKLPESEIYNLDNYELGNEIGKPGQPGYKRIYSRMIKAENKTTIEFLVIDAQGKATHFFKDEGETRVPHRKYPEAA